MTLRSPVSQGWENDLKELQHLSHQNGSWIGFKNMPANMPKRLGQRPKYASQYARNMPLSKALVIGSVSSRSAQIYRDSKKFACIQLYH